ncbi:unnamed protein product [Closterium sp. NIES-65]|nr:unnamed protein product [Closterium sp. NIES-65]
MECCDHGVDGRHLCDGCDSELAMLSHGWSVHNLRLPLVAHGAVVSPNFANVFANGDGIFVVPNGATKTVASPPVAANAASGAAYSADVSQPLVTSDLAALTESLWAELAAMDGDYRTATWQDPDAAPPSGWQLIGDNPKSPRRPAKARTATPLDKFCQQSVVPTAIKTGAAPSRAQTDSDTQQHHHYQPFAVTAMQDSVATSFETTQKHAAIASVGASASSKQQQQHPFEMIAAVTPTAVTPANVTPAAALATAPSSSSLSGRPVRVKSGAMRLPESRVGFAAVPSSSGFVTACGVPEVATAAAAPPGFATASSAPGFATASGVLGSAEAAQLDASVASNGRADQGTGLFSVRNPDHGGKESIHQSDFSQVPPAYHPPYSRRFPPFSSPFPAPFPAPFPTPRSPPFSCPFPAPFPGPFPLHSSNLTAPFASSAASLLPAAAPPQGLSLPPPYPSVLRSPNLPPTNRPISPQTPDDFSPSSPILSQFHPSHPLPSHPLPSHPLPSHPLPSHPLPSHPLPSHPFSHSHLHNNLSSSNSAPNFPLSRIFHPISFPAVPTSPAVSNAFSSSTSLSMPCSSCTLPEGPSLLARSCSAPLIAPAISNPFGTLQSTLRLPPTAQLSAVLQLPQSSSPPGSRARELEAFLEAPHKLPPSAAAGPLSAALQVPQSSSPPGSKAHELEAFFERSLSLESSCRREFDMQMFLKRRMGESKAPERAAELEEFLKGRMTISKGECVEMDGGDLFLKRAYGRMVHRG